MAFSFQLITIIVATLVISGLVIYLFRHKHKLEEKERNYAVQIRELQLSALSAQLNPHFVANSLNSIQTFILQQDVKKSSFFLSQFARLMRVTFEQMGKVSIPLMDELNTLKIYVNLERLRFGDRFDFELNVDPGVNINAPIPPLLLQPFVENSITHGLNQGSFGKVHVHISQSNGVIQVVIEDNGVGRSGTRSIKRGSGDRPSGGKLSIRRLMTLSDAKNPNEVHSIEDLCTPDGKPLGTRVTLKIPRVDEP